jgi:putative salt-induced outer membrane protein YdiY
MKLRNYLPLFFVVLFPLTQIGTCDVVTMKNGDRLTGSIVRLDGDKLTFKSDYGPITLPWASLVSITTSAPVYVELKGGRRVQGGITAENEAFTIKPSGANEVTATKADITAIRNPDEEHAFEVAQNPGFGDLWNGSVDLGYAQATGNSSTKNFAVAGTATRQTRSDKLNVFFTSLYATSNTDQVRGTTANAQRGGISYNRDISGRWFIFAQSNFEADEFQDLDFRFNPAAGLGYHLIKNDRGYLDLMAGGSYDRDYYSNNTIRSTAEIVAGDEFSYKFGAATTLFEKLQFFPAVSDLGQYRIAFDTNIAIAIRKFLAFQLGVSDRFLSDPVPGRKKNDLIYSTGLRFTFASKNQLPQ